MTRRRPTLLSLRLSTGPLALAVLAAGCHVQETRVTNPEADYAAELVHSRVEHRSGKKKPTWKPIVMGLLAGAAAASVTMVWVGFLQPNRPLAVSGIVLAVTVPTLGSIPFLLKQDDPWTKTDWSEWKPVPGAAASLDVMGRDEQPLVVHPLTADAEGNLHVPLAQLCDGPSMSALHLVDVVVRVPHAEEAATTLLVDRLPAPCGGGRLSLLGPSADREPTEPTEPGGPGEPSNQGGDHDPR